MQRHSTQTANSIPQGVWSLLGVESTARFCYNDADGCPGSTLAPSSSDHHHTLTMKGMQAP